MKGFRGWHRRWERSGVLVTLVGTIVGIEIGRPKSLRRRSPRYQGLHYRCLVLICFHFHYVGESSRLHCCSTDVDQGLGWLWMLSSKWHAVLSNYTTFEPAHRLRSWADVENACHVQRDDWYVYIITALLRWVSSLILKLLIKTTSLLYAAKDLSMAYLMRGYNIDQSIIENIKVFEPTDYPNLLVQIDLIDLPKKTQ